MDEPDKYAYAEVFSSLAEEPTITPMSVLDERTWLHVSFDTYRTGTLYDITAMRNNPRSECELLGHHLPCNTNTRQLAARKRTVNPPSRANVGGIARMLLPDMAPYFNMPLRYAAKVLNVSMPKLRLHCKLLGIQRWPYRKIKCMDTAISTAQAIGGPIGGALGNAQLSDVANLLARKKKEIEADPDIMLGDFTVRVTRRLYKLRRQTQSKECIKSCCGGRAVHALHIRPFDTNV